MIETSLYAVLSGNSAITAIVGTRIFPLTVPEDWNLPALTYQVISSVSHPTFSTAGEQRIRVQIDCWADTYSDAVSLRAAVISALNGYSDVNFTAQLLNKTDYYEHEALQYRCLIEFYLWSSDPS
jgi:hypothetical protein